MWICVTCAHGATVQTRNLPRNSESNARTSGAMLAGVAQAIKRAKDFLQFRRRHAEPLVGDRDPRFLSITIQMNVDHSSVRRVAHGVAHDVFNRTMQEFLRAFDLAFVRTAHVYSRVLRCGFEVCVLGDLVQQRA